MGIDNKNKMSSQYSDADEEYIFFMGLETLPSTFPRISCILFIKT